MVHPSVGHLGRLCSFGRLLSKQKARDSRLTLITPFSKPLATMRYLLISFFVLLGSLLALILAVFARLFGFLFGASKGPQAYSSTARSESGRGSDENGRFTSAEDAPKRSKVFTESEGEYVDFEEVR